MNTAFSPFCTALKFCNGTASVFYSSHITPLHYHNTLQVIVDLKGTFLFRTDNTCWRKYSSIVIKENVVHQLNTNGSLQFIVYIDPSLPAAHNLQEKYLKDADFCGLPIEFSPLEEALFHKTLINPETKSTGILTELIISRINEQAIPRLNGDRITRVLKLIKQTDPADLSISDLAGKVFILHHV